jgi:hypothetical protein
MGALIRVCYCHGTPCFERGDDVFCMKTHVRLERWTSAAGQAEGRRSRIADNPRRVKWCAGPCGRPLLVTEFYANGDGYPQAVCKACHRDVVRRHHRRRYKRDRDFREAEKARAMAAYWADPEKKRAAERTRHQAAKLRGAAA